MKVIYYFDNEEAGKMLKIYQDLLNRLPERLAEQMFSLPEDEIAEFILNMTDVINEMIDEIHSEQHSKPPQTNLSPKLEQDLRNLFKENK